MESSSDSLIDISDLLRGGPILGSRGSPYNSLNCQSRPQISFLNRRSIWLSSPKLTSCVLLWYGEGIIDLMEHVSTSIWKHGRPALRLDPSVVQTSRLIHLDGERSNAGGYVCGTLLNFFLRPWSDYTGIPIISDQAALHMYLDLFSSSPSCRRRQPLRADWRGHRT